MSSLYCNHLFDVVFQGKIGGKGSVGPPGPGGPPGEDGREGKDGVQGVQGIPVSYPLYLLQKFIK